MRIYNQDIGVEFSIEKRSILIMRRGKRQMTEGIEQPSQEKIRTLGDIENIKYLEILEAETIKQAERIEKNSNEYLRRSGNLLTTKLSSRNLEGMNIWVVLFVRYSGPFLTWTKKELQKMDQRTRTLKTMHKGLHSRDDINRLYVWRMKEEEDLQALKITSIHLWRLKDSIKKIKERLITATRNNTHNTRINRTVTRKQK